ncbi:MAG: DUF72 domain-containing protein [Gemmatimonadales bacterium]|nr:DUF72 domain-containing protein [Gemmatimonadales bacterium]NIN12903.1 DUF72 domain-containing protein [Gemmatimonadales bacterium]NIR00190.1 DUF72 domain-containing protein [Gemmatimonadales bacterium]NIS65983.1 DUF72 domain-containing protein [Gemmatimonadales bacterium]
MAELLLGTQGWNYGCWIGPFYPRGTKPSGMLGIYAKAFPTVEVDATSYGLPADPVVDGWRQRVPERFRFALRIPQEITHERRLKDTERVLRRFLDRVSGLGERLGPLLVQLSPAFRPTESNRDILRNFLDRLPGGYRWVVEFRHPGWMTPATSELLKERRVALALVDGRWIRREMMPELAIEPTADFAYIRWLGAERRLADFSRVQLERDREFQMWATTIVALSGRVSTIYGYFSNHYQGHAPHSVREFQRIVGQEPVPPEALREQVELL